MLKESMQVGRVTCDFMRMDDFLQTCHTWLMSSEFHHIVTLNPEMVVEAQANDAFQQAISNAQLRVPDGSGLVWAQWYVRSQFWSLFWSLVAFSFRDVERITGVDTVLELSRMAAAQDLGVYLLGGTSSQVRRTAELLQKKFPDIRIKTSPDHTFDMNGPAQILHDIQTHQPAILFVAYGAPKQSIWIHQHRSALPSVRIAVGVGGAFAILSEEKPRAPRWLRRFNLEWLWRLWLEPGRWPRIWKATVEFPLLVKRQKDAARSSQATSITP